MASQYCPSCGTGVDDTADFCSNCGEQIGGSDTVVQNIIQQQQQQQGGKPDTEESESVNNNNVSWSDASTGQKLGSVFAVGLMGLIFIPALYMIYLILWVPIFGDPLGQFISSVPWDAVGIIGLTIVAFLFIGALDKLGFL